MALMPVWIYGEQIWKTFTNFTIEIVEKNLASGTKNNTFVISTSKETF